jgi:hypothetical protein
MSQNFITNAQKRTLEGRLKTLIKHSKELKFLVGFFYFHTNRSGKFKAKKYKKPRGNENRTRAKEDKGKILQS